MDSNYKECWQCGLEGQRSRSKLDEMEIEELADIRSQLSEFEKTFDRFTAEIDSVSPDVDDIDSEKWNDAISNYFDKI